MIWARKEKGKQTFAFYFTEHYDFTLTCAQWVSTMLKSLVHIKPPYECFKNDRAEVHALKGCQSDSFLISQSSWANISNAQVEGAALLLQGSPHVNQGKPVSAPRRSKSTARGKRGAWSGEISAQVSFGPEPGLGRVMHVSRYPGSAPLLICSRYEHQQNKGEDSSSNLKPQHLSTYVQEANTCNWLRIWL